MKMCGIILGEYHATTDASPVNNFDGDRKSWAVMCQGAVNFCFEY